MAKETEVVSETESLPSKPESARRKGPVVIGDVERRGAIRSGRMVRRIIVIYEDGGRSRLDCRRRDDQDVKPVDASKLTPSERSIVEFFVKLETTERIKGSVVSSLLTMKYDTARRALSSLVRMQVLINGGDAIGYFRGPAFPQAVQ